MGRRTNGRAVCLFWPCLVDGVFAPSIARAQQVVGTVTELSGSAQIQRAGATIAAVQGMSVQLHDRLVTSVDSSATVTLASGITLTSPNIPISLSIRSVTAAADWPDTQLNLVEGGLRSLVPPLLRTQTFEVHTPNAITAVRGTDFDTTYIEGVARPGYGGCQRYTDVRVREGVVAVSNLANPTRSGRDRGGI